MKAPVVLFLALGIMAAGLSAQDPVQTGDISPGGALKVFITFDDDDFAAHPDAVPLAHNLRGPSDCSEGV